MDGNWMEAGIVAQCLGTREEVKQETGTQTLPEGVCRNFVCIFLFLSRFDSM